LDIFRIFKGKAVRKRVEEDEIECEKGNNDVFHPQIYVMVRISKWVPSVVKFGIPFSSGRN
jgi:hypothetical protein